MSNEHFDNFSNDINTDDINGEEDGKIQFDEEENDGERGGENLCSNPKIVLEASGSSNQHTESRKDISEKESNLPTENEVVAGLKTHSEQALNNFERAEATGKEKKSGMTEDC